MIANRRRLFPDFRNDIFVRDISQIIVCADCAGISVALMQKDQSIRDPYLSSGDRRACIADSQPNSAHEIDFEIARHRAIANESYAAASAAFVAFRGRVRDFAGRFERGRRLGDTEKDLIEAFAEDLRVFHHIENPAECMALAKWLLTQDTGRDSDESGTTKVGN